MLPIASKLLTVQIITTTTLITIMLLSCSYSTTESLPITSKPIESTVENLAWEAWLMVPVGQQQKSRKVTPKSIFIVPKKKNQTTPIHCPPGEHLFESRCIPHVSINTEKILVNLLTNLDIPSGDYDYDYDDANDAPGAEKLEGSIEMIPSSIPNAADEPLKFDIFRDNFPIGSSGSGDSSGGKDSEDESAFFNERRRRPPTPVDTALPDLDTDSATYGSHNESVDDSTKDDEEESTVFLSGIDAILVPAVSDAKGQDQNLNFSIYQEAANTTTANSEVEVLIPLTDKNVDLQQILEDESLFLDKGHKLITTTEKIETTTDLFEAETTTLKLDDDENVESKTEFTRSVTDLAPVDEETTISSTDSTEIGSTVVTEQEDITTTMIPSDETTMSTDSTPEITTINNSNEEGTTIMNVDSVPTKITNTDDRSTITSSPVAEAQPLPMSSDNRYVYQHLSDAKPPPPVIDISAELKMINDLVAKKSRPLKLTTPAAPSVEATSTSSNLWMKIIPSSNAIVTTPDQTSIRSSTSSSNILRNSSSSSTVSSTDSQGSVADSSPPTTSTSPGPPIAASDPLWWLPTGWRVDRTTVDRPLLLRFWSALSGIGGSQTKV